MRATGANRSLPRLVTLLLALPVLLYVVDARAELDRETADHVAASTVLLSVRIIEQVDGVPQIHEECALGSGSIISSTGAILTNHHVLVVGLEKAASYAEMLTQERNDPSINYAADQKVVVWMVDAEDQAPNRRYTAEVVEPSSATLDLAVAQITGDARGNEYAEQHPRNPLEHLTIGDSNPRSWPTNDITIHGYPWAEPEDDADAIGTPGCAAITDLPDETIQRTGGEYSGSERDDLGNARVLYAAGTVWFGNSGGSAVDDRGHLIGVPTRFEPQGGGSRVVLIPINRAKSYLREVVPGVELDVTPALPESPTTSPTYAPPATMEPTAAATVALTSPPTAPPTSTPTATNTATPTPEPTSTPTATPTSTQTPEPTATNTPEPTAASISVPAGWEVAYADDFEDPGASQLGTVSSDPSSRRYRFESGEYVIEKVAPEAGAPAKYLPGTNRDVVVAIDARLVGETENRYAFVTCRDEGPMSHEYRLSVEPAATYFRLSRWENGEVTILADGVREDAIEPGEGINRVQLSCVGTEITAWVNGVEVARVEDDRLREGRVGIGTGVYSGQTGTIEARFDNLEVIVPHATTTGSAGLELPTPTEHQIASTDTSQDGQNQSSGTVVNIELIFDSSGSMAQESSAGQTRIEAARTVLNNVIDGLPEEQGINVGFRVYGHEGSNQQADRAESCQSSELMVPIDGVDKPALRNAVEDYQPVGWTPISLSLERAADDFEPPAANERNAIVLVTDGLETCGGDPCAAAEDLAQGDDAVTVYVIGFGLSDEELATLQCVAEAGGGLGINPSNAAELEGAILTVLDELLP